MRNARILIGAAMVALTSVEANAQRRASLVIPLVAPAEEESGRAAKAQDAEYPLAPLTAQGSERALARMLREPSIALYLRANDESGMFKSGPGRAFADGIAAGAFVFSVTHFVDSGAAIKAGVVGGSVVCVGELLWQQIHSRSERQ